MDGKTELRKEIDRRKQRQQQRDDEQQRRMDRRSSFELRLEQQANKLHLVTVATALIITHYISHLT